MDPGQLHVFLEWARSDRLFPLWRTLGFTGLRRGEALGLQWRDLRFQDRLLAVRRALITAGTSTYLTAPKSSQSRVIDLEEETVEVLKAHREESKNLRPESNPDDFVFTDRNGAPVVPNLITRQFRGLVCASPVPRIRFHDLRHTHASHLLESGASISSVQERLGHSDVVVTLNLYSHVLPGSQRLAVDRLESFYDNWGSSMDRESSSRLN
ncbi:MAG: tyrosine-type recombinase/integrase [Actinobacteria bacterium]|nr:tyrosine-type recombinase/integrase [Actinomycetota bacterium]